ncbi:MAG: hypothetical protein FJ291_05050 [Planctomycetes bacterium]|nr:hypothetical protein [Planctomycetota bacterium]
MAAEKREPEQLKLTVAMKNFGPIADGEVELKPLTIFVGPNNSGKSYAATLIHSIFQSCVPSLHLLGPAGTKHGFPMRLMKMALRQRKLPDVQGIHVPPPGQAVPVAQSVLRELGKDALNWRWVPVLPDEVARALACAPRDLVRIGQDAFEVGIGARHYSARLRCADEAQLEITEIHPPELAVYVRCSETQDEAHVAPLAKPKGDTYEIIVPSEPSSLEALGVALRELAAEALLDTTTRTCWYLPSARSGILQGYRTLAAGAIAHASEAGAGRPKPLQFSGVVADMIAALLTLPAEEGSLATLASRFEQEALGGQIALVSTETFLPREIRYRFKGTDIPIQRSSSTVSELAPLILYLRHLVEPGSVLVIEEPEAHLHPENQRVVAKCLVELVRLGVYVLITTHSDWLISQLSSLVKLSRVEPRVRAQVLHLPGELSLAPESVGAYVFSYDHAAQGYNINRLAVDDEGIPEDEFLRIHEVLYEESLSIDRILMED